MQRLKRMEEVRAGREGGGTAAEAEAGAKAGAEAGAEAGVEVGAEAAGTHTHTVAFVMSDGDNLQWLQNDWRSEQWYGAPERGAMPIGWTVPAAAVHLLPTILSWLTKHATANDTFIAGPSGAGYAFAEKLPGARAAPFAQATAQLMAQAGLSLLNVIGSVPTAESLHELTAQPLIDAVLYWTFDSDYSGLRGNVAYINGKPVIGGRRSLWGDGSEGTALGPQALADSLATLPKDPTDPNAYSLVPVHAWSHNYSSVLHAARLLQERGGFDVVSPEELVRRLEHAEAVALGASQLATARKPGLVGLTLMAQGSDSRSRRAAVPCRPEPSERPRHMHPLILLLSIAGAWCGGRQGGSSAPCHGAASARGASAARSPATAAAC